MPIYEYKCQACNHELEAIQKMSDAALLDCPNCGQSTLKKRISAAAFRLKGGGWYETDFKSGGKKNLAGDTAGSGDTAKAESGVAAKTDGAAPATTPSAGKDAS